MRRGFPDIMALVLRRYSIFFCKLSTVLDFDWPFGTSIGVRLKFRSKSLALHPSCSPCSGSLSFASPTPHGRLRPTRRRQQHDLNRTNPPPFLDDGRGRKSRRSLMVHSLTLSSGPHRFTDNTMIRLKFSSAR